MAPTSGEPRRPAPRPTPRGAEPGPIPVRGVSADPMGPTVAWASTVTDDETPQLPVAHRLEPLRPSPGFRVTFPRHEVRSAFFERQNDDDFDDLDDLDDEASAPGRLARLYGAVARVGRDPRSRQRGSVGVIAAGVGLFVVAALAAPLAGAEPKNKPTVVAAEARNGAAGNQLIIVPSTAASSSSASGLLLPNPVHAASRAPADHGTISGLAANGIPKVALNAYRVAAARMANVQPGCGIDWSLLAGIGRVESDHGRFGGAVLHADGVSTPSIIGPALDGKGDNKYIPAPRNGLALDGDAKYAHALGPMQFIPSTWASYGTDADGDAKADIFNINDAALSAARYLCAAGGNLTNRAGQVTAVLAYNHSDEYVAEVLALADAYHRGVVVTGIPKGITKGGLPLVVDTGYLPPVNPGPPTAVHHKKHTSTSKSSSASASSSRSGSASASKSGSTIFTPAATSSGAKGSSSGASSSSSTSAGGGYTPPVSAADTSTSAAPTDTSSSSESTQPVGNPVSSLVCGLLPC